MNLRLCLLIIVVAVAPACTTAPPSLDTSPSAELSFDGLYPVRNTSADMAWARKGLDLSGYDKIMLQSAGIEYRPGGARGGTFAARSRGGPYEVTNQQKARFSKLVADIFQDELGKSTRYTLTDEPGPNVLLIRGAILDVVSYVPPEPLGRADFYISEIGEATLVLEIRDAITEAILVRVIDQRAAEQGGGFMLMESNRATNTAEVRRVVRFWASTLRKRLDEFGG